MSSEFPSTKIPSFLDSKMRLLHTTELKLYSFNEVGKDVPTYAILSHTWGKEEVTFQDIHCNPDVASMAGYQKITASCRIARREGYQFIWIDTCCIDKSSSAELSEAINSMYRWYEHSAMCFAFLEDVVYPYTHSYWVTKKRVREPDPPVETFEGSFGNSRWFTRGWTLQELIAPPNLRFHDCNWRLIDTKDGLYSLISKITGIDEDVLARPGELQNASVAQRMYWASRRETTRSEDLAYCLMGIFGIAMPLLYGEGGTKAFLRLQQEILNSTDDHSIFLWTLPPHEVVHNELRGLLAESPSWFSHARRISQSQHSHEDDCSTLSRITNRGLFLELPAVDLNKDGVGDVLLLPSCDIEPGIPSAIIVRKIDGTVNDEYARILVGVPMAIKSRRIAIWEDTVVDEVTHATVRMYSRLLIERQSIYKKSLYVSQRPQPQPWRVQGYWFTIWNEPSVFRIVAGCENLSIGYVYHQPVVVSQRSALSTSQWKQDRQSYSIFIDINHLYKHRNVGDHQRVISLAALDIEVWMKLKRFPTIGSPFSSGEADVGAGRILQLRLILGADFNYHNGLSLIPTITPAWSLELTNNQLRQEGPRVALIEPNSKEVSLRPVGLEDLVAYAEIKREERDLRMWYVVSFGIKRAGHA
ncbi:uncharacterized protein QC763_506490 [Podospora pseudopauciseta]|uniref:Heterokaryon incompatibility domain-containing protein n=1 Tax=Podospora pseudopauciseta TaxID=2093780 RepID=A0ABR0HA54_9PEZI|nr:hypothetical protein QC763_506490 [Podospora pseudopauciseta]